MRLPGGEGKICPKDYMYIYMFLSVINCSLYHGYASVKRSSIEVEVNKITTY